jgi:hypothetical protein
MIKNWRFLFLLSIVSSQSFASQGMPQFLLKQSDETPIIMEVTPVVILNAAAPTQTQNGGSIGWTGAVATGFGLLTSVSLFSTPFDAEIGAIYLNQSSEREISSVTHQQNSHQLHVPLIIRYNFDDKVGIGFGGYASFGKGNITNSQNGTSSLSSYSESGIHNRDFGLLFSLRASLQIVPQFYFIVDGRYKHGLSNLANIPPGISGDIYNTRSMQAYLGLSYRFLLF